MGFPSETIPRLLLAVTGLFVAVVVMVCLSVWLGESRFLRLFARIRFPLLIAFCIVFLVPLGFTFAPSMVYGVFVLEGPAQFASVTCASLLLAMLSYATTRLAIEHGDERFGPSGYRNLSPGAWRIIRRATIFPVAIVVPAAAAVATYRDEADPNLWTIVWITAGIAAGYFAALTLWYVFALLERVLIPPALVLPGFFPVSGWSGLDNERRLPTDPFWSVIARGFGGPGNGYTHVVGDRLMLKPGHAQLIVFWMALTLLYVSRYFSAGLLGFATGEGTPLPVLFHVLTILLLVGSTLTGAAFLLDYYRLPVTAVLLVGAVGANIAFDNDHFYDLRESANHVHAPVEIENVFKAWKFPTGLDRKRTLIVVTASGGGIQASAWTAKVLTELGMRYRGFHDSIGLISGVSGGSVATMYYTLYAPTRDNAGGAARRSLPEDRAQAIYRDSTRSNLEAAAWGFAYPDLMRLAFPPLVPDQVDRGWAMEQVWGARLQQRGFKIGGPEEPTLRSLARRVAEGKSLVPVFNATIVETGQRVVMSPVHGIGTKAERQELPWDFFELYPDADLRVTTAVRLSATFSYVSPICRPGTAHTDAHRFHLADGGYADNEGLITALKTAFESAAYLDNSKFDRILLVRIVPFPPSKPKASSSRMGWLFSTFGPLLTLNSVRVASQAERGNFELENLYPPEVVKALLPNVEFHTIQFAFEPTDKSYVPPLSWKLTQRDFRAIDDAWRNFDWRYAGPGGNQPPEYLDKIFERVKTPAEPGPSPAESPPAPRLATRPDR
jgi:hypothetical protein